MAKIQPQSVGLAPELPRHIGIIMDGNGRYATRRGLPRKLGHRAGMERLRGLIRFSSDIGIEVLSLYAFSTENWKRPKEEIGALFDLFLEYFISELDDLDKNNVCIRIMGDMSAFPEKMGQETDEAMYKTRNNTGLKLNIALNYGSRAEVVRACNTLIERGKPVDEADGNRRNKRRKDQDHRLSIRQGREPAVPNRGRRDKDGIHQIYLQRPGTTDQNTKRAGAGTERCQLVQRRNLYL